ncbi:hypothetical protein O6H91_Y562100 [Diphasiastrum complanatum]|nr:hypothetical protein O6H91_Y562100 [Diphasiastrum complanatum]
MYLRIQAFCQMTPLLSLFFLTLKPFLLHNLLSLILQWPFSSVLSRPTLPLLKTLFVSLSFPIPNVSLDLNLFLLTVFCCISAPTWVPQKSFLLLLFTLRILLFLLLSLAKFLTFIMPWSIKRELKLLEQYATL